MKLVPYLLAVYVITKPFYLWSSGLPQISDFVLLLSFVIMLFSVHRDKLRQTIVDNKFFFLFLFFVVVINLLYSVYYTNSDFLLHTIYYIFDALGIIIFSITMKQMEDSRRILSNSFKISLLVQLALYLLDLGRYYGAVRYMGTFNDPNQFAYYVFLSFSFIYLFSLKNKDKSSWIFLIISLFLIFQSMSTGMLVGMIVFVIIYLIALVKKALKTVKGRFVLMMSCYSLIAVSIVVGGFLWAGGNGVLNVSNTPLLSRIEEKIDRAQGNSDVSLWQERGYDRMIFYPQYNLFGAGEGMYSRFELAYHQGELHATLPSILFSYGLMPLVFILIWIFNKIKGTKLEVLCVYLALLIESFTLINSRQVLFWVIFLLPQIILIGDKNEKES